MLWRSFNVNLWLSKKSRFENLKDWCFLLLCSHNRNLHTAYCPIQRVVLADTDWVWNELYARDNSTSILENLKFEMYSSFLWNVTISLLLLCSLKSFCCRWHKLHRSLKILLLTLKTSSWIHWPSLYCLGRTIFFQVYSFVFI